MGYPWSRKALSGNIIPKLLYSPKQFLSIRKLLKIFRFSAVFPLFFLCFSALLFLENSTILWYTFLSLERLGALDYGTDFLWGTVTEYE